MGRAAEEEYEVPTMDEFNELKADLNALEEKSINYVNIVNGTYTTKGCTAVFDKTTQTVKVIGTATGSGGRDVLYNHEKIILPAGDYKFTIIPSVTDIQFCLTSIVTPFPMVINGAGVFTLAQETECYLGINLDNGKTVNATYKFQVEKGVSYTGYKTPFTTRDYEARTISSDIDNIVNSVIVANANMFDKNNTLIKTDTYITTNGYASASGLRVTHPIKVKKNDIIKFIKASAVGQNYYYAYVNTDGSISKTINATANAVTAGYMVITVPYDGYIAVNMGREDVNAFMVCKSNEYPSQYVPYGYSIKEDVSVKASNVLYGKIWYACGDSFTHGDFSGLSDIYDSSVYDPVWGVWKTYPWWIAKRNNMILHNMATNGGTLAVPPSATGTHPFAEEIYNQIGNDADYITIWYGINDCYYDDIGTINDTTSATFYGAWNKVLAYLIEHHPYAKIGIVCSASNPTVGLPFREATRACAKKWGIPYLDQMGDPQIPLMLYGKESDIGLSSEALNLRKNAFIVSETNVHPNVKAHEYESTFIEHWMRSL